VLGALRERLDLDDVLWTLARDVAKYGERAEEIIVGSNMRIDRIKPLPTERVIPQKDEYGRWVDPYRYKQINDQGKVVAQFPSVAGRAFSPTSPAAGT
jgi:hypothetical protein